LSSLSLITHHPQLITRWGFAIGLIVLDSGDNQGSASQTAGIPDTIMSKKILIADDNTFNRELLQDALKRFKTYGVTILTTENGTKTFEVAKQEKPDLLLLDIMMPGMSGYEICEKLKNDPEFKDIYIIMVSARTQQEDRMQAAKMGADEYVTKPYDIRLIRERVQKVLNIDLI
jgi:two-component system alkaline phosphatase synthesis response regulator PhoP